jgi:hypothetical protein
MLRAKTWNHYILTPGFFSFIILFQTSFNTDNLCSSGGGAKTKHRPSVLSSKC